MTQKASDVPSIALHYLARQARFDYRVLSGTRLDRTSELVDRADALAREIDRIAGLLGAEIHAVVPAACPEDRRRWLTTKRSLFNRRPLSRDGERAIATQLNTSARTLFAAWKSRFDEWRTLGADIQSSFDVEGAACRRQLAELLTDPDWRRGVHLSGPQILATADDYIHAARERLPLTKRLRKSEIALIGYVTRMALKPTPLGSFTGIALGRFDAPEPSDEDGEARRTVRITRSVLVQIERAIASAPAFRDFAMLRVNATCAVKDGTLEFIAAPPSDGAIAIAEKLRSIAIQPALEAALAALAGGPRSQADLEDVLNRRGAKGDAGRRFIDGLIALGVIERTFGVPDQTDRFIDALARRAHDVGSDVGAHTYERLMHLAQIERSLARAHAGDRARLCDELRACVFEITRSLDVASIDLDQVRSLFYEDVAIAPKLSLPPALRSQLTEPFDILRRLLPLFSVTTVEQLTLYRRFERLYPRESAAPTVLDFYRKDARTPYAERTRTLPEDEAAALESLQGRFFDHLGERLRARPDANEVAIDPEFARSLALDLPAWVVPWESMAFRCQIFDDGDGEPCAVLNGIGLGYGKPFSRFCRIFDGDGDGDGDAREPSPGNLESHVRAASARRPTDRVYADLLAVFGLNINLHPPLLAAEVVYPGAQSARPACAISLHDLLVVPDPTRRRLTLRRRHDGIEVRIVPLNFLFPLLAPPFYQFLCQFGPGRETQWVAWDRYDAQRADRDPSDVGHYPRLTLGRLVVDRATWKIPRPRLPMARAGDHFDAQRFVDLRRWRAAVGLPETVFYQGRTLLDPASEKGDRAPLAPFANDVPSPRRAPMPRQRKPICVDFRSSFQLKAFDRFIRDCDGDVTVKETLPRMSGERNGSLDARATEYVFELDAFEPARCAR